MSGLLSTYLKRFEETQDHHSFNRKYFAYNVSRFINRARIFQLSYPRAKWCLFPLWGLLSVKCYQEYSEVSRTTKEIAFRKQQLVKPVYQLTPEESVDFPWTEENLKDWLYRPVKISGRPIHNKGKMVPRNKYGLH